MSKSQKSPTIEIVKRTNLGILPMFIRLGHRSLQKGNPTGTVTGKLVYFPIAKDLVDLTVEDKSLLTDIDSIHLVYRTKEKVNG